MARLTQNIGLTRYEADERYKQALTYYQKGELDNAILEMNAAIDLLPKNPEYYAARGLFYLEDADEEEAEGDFAQALKIHPYEMLALWGRGVLAYRGKRWDETLEYFKMAYRAEPDRAETLYYLALAYHRTGDNASAAALMEQAVERFNKAEDAKHRRSAERWLREMEKLRKQAEG